MTATESTRGARFALSIGLMAVAGGLWLFLDAQEIGIPRFKDLWPMLLLLAGAAMLVDLFFLSRRPGSAGLALMWIGFGILFFALTLDYTNWRKILDWLPSFPTIFGVSLFATWLADGRRHDNQVIAGGILVGLGLLGYAARFDWLQKILPSAQVVWAVLLVAGGGYLVYRTVSQAKS